MGNIPKKTSKLTSQTTSRDPVKEHEISIDKKSFPCLELNDNITNQKDSSKALISPFLNEPTINEKFEINKRKMKELGLSKLSSNIDIYGKIKKIHNFLMFFRTSLLKLWEKS